MKEETKVSMLETVLQELARVSPEKRIRSAELLIHADNEQIIPHIKLFSTHALIDAAAILPEKYLPYIKSRPLEVKHYCHIWRALPSYTHLFVPPQPHNSIGGVALLDGISSGIWTKEQLMANINGYSGTVIVEVMRKHQEIIAELEWADAPTAGKSGDELYFLWRTIIRRVCRPFPGRGPSIPSKSIIDGVETLLMIRSLQGNPIARNDEILISILNRCKEMNK